MKNSGYHNVCCATYVSWVLREAHYINETTHGAYNLGTKLQNSGNFMTVSNIKSGEVLSYNNPNIQEGDILCYNNHIEIAAGANTVYSAGNRANEIWVDGPTARKTDSKTRTIRFVLRAYK